MSSRSRSRLRKPQLIAWLAWVCNPALKFQTVYILATYFYRQKASSESDSAMANTTSVDAEFSLIAALREKPTIANAFRAWLSHCETALNPPELQSARNFARAFQIWFDKANCSDQSESCETVDINLYPLAGEVELFASELHIMDDPIEERLNPISKTTNIGKNCRNLITFLSNHQIISEKQTTFSYQICTFLEEEIKRCTRARWILIGQDIFFTPALKGRKWPLDLDDKEPVSTYEVTTIKDNFVLADRRATTEDSNAYAGHNPYKIQVPPSSNRFLKIGDEIQAELCKVREADYSVLTHVIGVEPGSRKYIDRICPFRGDPADAADLSELNLAITDHLSLLDITTLPNFPSKSPEYRHDDGYKQREAKLLETTPPMLEFPDETHTEEWFTARETDIAADEEVGSMWDGGDDLEDFEDETSEDDE